MKSPINIFSTFTSLFTTTDSKQDPTTQPIYRIQKVDNNAVRLKFDFAGEQGEDARIQLDMVKHELIISLNSDTREYETRMTVNSYLTPRDIVAEWHEEGVLDILLKGPSESAEDFLVDIGIHLSDDPVSSEPEENETLAPVSQLFAFAFDDSEFFDITATFVNIISRRGGRITEADLVAESMMLLDTVTSKQINEALMFACSHGFITIDNEGIVTLLNEG